MSSHPEALPDLFHQQRAALAARVPVTAVPGLGTEAFQYAAVGQNGLSLDIYDENLIMRLSWTAKRPATSRRPTWPRRWPAPAGPPFACSARSTAAARLLGKSARPPVWERSQTGRPADVRNGARNGLILTASRPDRGPARSRLGGWGRMTATGRGSWRSGCGPFPAAVFADLLRDSGAPLDARALKRVLTRPRAGRGGGGRGVETGPAEPAPAPVRAVRPARPLPVARRRRPPRG